MSEEREVRDWWNAMTRGQRIDKAHELHLFTPWDDWSLPWDELMHVGQQMRLHMLYDGVMR